MPTREEAIETLYELINSGILSKDMEEQLENIAKCIEVEDAEESLGISIWGAEDDDWTELFIAYRDDLWTDELNDMLQVIYDKYKIQRGNANDNNTDE